jgi:hypothetical protein
MEHQVSSLSLFSYDYFATKRSAVPKAYLKVPTPVYAAKPHIEDSTSDSEASTCCLDSHDTDALTQASPNKQPGLRTDYCKMAKSKQGSKRLQKIIAKGEHENIEKIVMQTAAFIPELMMDKFGNYMCQALFQTCSTQQRLMILRSLRPVLVKLATHPIGTHALQKLAVRSSHPEESAIYEAELRPHVVFLATHVHGTHVVQVLAAGQSTRSFVALEISTKAQELALNQLGMCVVKKCLFSREVVHALLPHTLTLAQDAYGNYAVQELLNRWGCEFSSVIGYHLQPHIVRLSTHKFASNVVEKCIKYQPLGQVVARTLLDAEHIGAVMSNVFGCYVLKAIANQLPSLRPLLKIRAGEASARLTEGKLKGRQDRLAIILESS